MSPLAAALALRTATEHRCCGTQHEVCGVAGLSRVGGHSGPWIEAALMLHARASDKGPVRGLILAPHVAPRPTGEPDRSAVAPLLPHSPRSLSSTVLFAPLSKL